MTQIKDYVLLLVGACLVCGGLTILAPGGRFERIMQIVGSIFLLLCMLTPLAGTINKLFNFNDLFDFEYAIQEANAWDYSSNVMEQTLKSDINSHIVTVLGHEAEDIDIVVDHNSSDFLLTRIFIMVSPEDLSKKTAISDYIFIKTGARPTVISREKEE